MPTPNIVTSSTKGLKIDPFQVPEISTPVYMIFFYFIKKTKSYLTFSRMSFSVLARTTAVRYTKRWLLKRKGINFQQNLRWKRLNSRIFKVFTSTRRFFGSVNVTVWDFGSRELSGTDPVPVLQNTILIGKSWRISVWNWDLVEKTSKYDTNWEILKKLGSDGKTDISSRFRNSGPGFRRLPEVFTSSICFPSSKTGSELI